ncbi:MAG: hypothetical protein WC503_00780 [Candidatus Shapirobacteria bacterium]
MNQKLPMRYDVEYEGVLTTIYEDISGEFETLVEAKEAAIKHLHGIIEMAVYQITHIAAMQK